MDVYKTGKELFLYGEIVKDNNVLTLEGWERICVFRYNGDLYWLKMRRGEFLEVDKIS